MGIAGVGIGGGKRAVDCVRTRPGNELGLSETEVAALPAAQLHERLSAARERLSRAAAHVVIESVADLPPVLTELEQRLASGKRP